MILIASLDCGCTVLGSLTAIALKIALTFSPVLADVSKKMHPFSSAYLHARQKRYRLPVCCTLNGQNTRLPDRVTSSSSSKTNCSTYCLASSVGTALLLSRSILLPARPITMSAEPWRWSSSIHVCRSGGRAGGVWERGLSACLCCTRPPIIVSSRGLDRAFGCCGYCCLPLHR